VTEQAIVEQRTIEIEGVDTEAIQKHTLRVLRASTIFSRGAVSAMFPVASLAIKDLLGEDSPWLGTTTVASTIGAAAAAVMLAAYMQRKGRTPGLSLGLGVAVLGAAICLLAVQASSVWVLLGGMLLVGVGSGTSNLSRYAAADLASDNRRSRDISSIIGFSTFGAVAFPLLIGVAAAIASSGGLKERSGGFAMGAGLFLISALAIRIYLNPDPLVVAGGVDPEAGVRKRAVPFREAVKIAWAHPRARLAFVALVVSQAVMVMVMSMTPAHMDAHDHGDGIVGAVISAHTAGMFAFAPVAGWLSDRFGRVQIVVAAGFTLLLATVLTALAGNAPVLLMFPGLFLLGLGWSFGIVAGSALLTESVHESERVAVQGAADLATNIASGAGALAAGLILSMTGFHILSMIGMAAAGALIAQSWFENRLAALRR